MSMSSAWAVGVLVILLAGQPWPACAASAAGKMSAEWQQALASYPVGASAGQAGLKNVLVRLGYDAQSFVGENQALLGAKLVDEAGRLQAAAAAESRSDGALEAMVRDMDAIEPALGRLASAPDLAAYQASFAAARERLAAARLRGERTIRRAAELAAALSPRDPKGSAVAAASDKTENAQDAYAKLLVAQLRQRYDWETIRRLGTMLQDNLDDVKYRGLILPALLAGVNERTSVEKSQLLFQILLDAALKSRDEGVQKEIADKLRGELQAQFLGGRFSISDERKDAAYVDSDVADYRHKIVLPGLQRLAQESPFDGLRAAMIEGLARDAAARRRLGVSHSLYAAAVHLKLIESIAVGAQSKEIKGLAVAALLKEMKAADYRSSTIQTLIDGIGVSAGGLSQIRVPAPRPVSVAEILRIPAAVGFLAVSAAYVASVASRFGVVSAVAVAVAAAWLFWKLMTLALED